MPAIYDAENSWGADDEFFLGVANRHPKSRVLDLGCGTGRLTTALAAAQHNVTGLDPNGTSLRRARAKPHGDKVLWVEGTSRCLAPTNRFDTVLMTSHVAQVFVSDDEWGAVLDDARGTLAPGGVLAFDSRDPRAKAWERWTKEQTQGTVELPDGQQVVGWVDVTDVSDNGVVTFDWCNVFEDGSRLAGTSSLRFRSEQRLRTTLEEAGFIVDDLYGGWRNEPSVPDGSTSELVVVARA